MPGDSYGVSTGGIKGIRSINSQTYWSNTSSSSGVDNSTWSTIPTKNVIFIASGESGVSAYQIAQTGYEYNFMGGAGPTSGYRAISMWIGRPTGLANPGAAVTVGGGGWYASDAVEFENLKGELLYLLPSYASSASFTTPAFAKGIREKGAIAIAAWGMVAGGLGVTGYTNTSGVPFRAFSVGENNLQYCLWSPVVPYGSFPQITFTGGRSTNCSGFIAILR